MNFKLPSLAGMVLLLAIVGCTLPAEPAPPPNDIQTAAALTLQAILTPTVASPSSTPVIATVASPRGTQTASTVSPSPASGSPTISATPTYSVPVLTVSESTNCRTGPGEEYEVIVVYATGRELEIVGRYDPENFWLVKSNESPTGTCWLWGEFVELTGSYWAVSSVTPPATATGAPPRAAAIIEWFFFCEGGNLNFTVTWRDDATDETGYRIFRNGEAIVELPANSTTYTDLYDIPAEQSVEYYVQTYSPAGSANTSIMRMRCGVQ